MKKNLLFEVRDVNSYQLLEHQRKVVLENVPISPKLVVCRAKCILDFMQTEV